MRLQALHQAYRDFVNNVAAQKGAAMFLLEAVIVHWKQGKNKYCPKA